MFVLHFCDKERLDSLKQNINGKEISVYDKHCLHLSKEEVEKIVAESAHLKEYQDAPETPEALVPMKNSRM